MSITTALHTRSASLSSIFSVLRLMAVRRAAYRSTMKDLNRLSNRELEDIGLVRGDIGRVARDTAAQVR